MDNSFNGVRGMLKWPFSYKGTSLVQKTSSGPLQTVPGSILGLPPVVKRQLPQLWLPQGQHKETITGSAGWCLGKGRGALLLPCSHAGSSVSALAALPLAKPPAAGLRWSTAAALLRSVHHPKHCQLHSYAGIVASFAGNENKAQCWH